MATMVLCGFAPKEVSACRLMTRGMNVLLVEADWNQMGGTLEDALLGKKAPGTPEGTARRMVVFAGADGTQLDKLIPIPARATGEPVLRAVMTKFNRKWTLKKLCGELQKENRAMEKALKS